jgi:hypothetical protein
MTDDEKNSKSTCNAPHFAATILYYDVTEMQSKDLYNATNGDDVVTEK